MRHNIRLRLHGAYVHVDAQGGRTGVQIRAFWPTCVEVRGLGNSAGQTFYVPRSELQ